MDLICLAAEGEPYGCLRDKYDPFTDAFLMSRCHMSKKEFAAYLGELLSKNRVVRETSGVLIIPQMIEQERVRQARASGGKLGGNPHLKSIIEGYPSTLPLVVNLALQLPSNGPRARKALSLSSGLGVLSGTDFEKRWEAAGFDSPEDFETWFVGLARRHPSTRLKGIQIAKDGLRIAFMAGKTTRNAVEHAYAQLQRSRDWRDGIVPNLATIVTDSFWDFASTEIAETIDPATARDVAELAAAVAEGREREYWIQKGCTSEDADQFCKA